MQPLVGLSRTFKSRLLKPFDGYLHRIGVHRKVACFTARQLPWHRPRGLRRTPKEGYQNGSGQAGGHEPRPVSSCRGSARCRRMILLCLRPHQNDSTFCSHSLGLSSAGIACREVILDYLGGIQHLYAKYMVD
ncbi:MAG: hypothetical protein WBP10_12445 [Thermoanaerobaculia bacterium]